MSVLDVSTPVDSKGLARFGGWTKLGLLAGGAAIALFVVVSPSIWGDATPEKGPDEQKRVPSAAEPFQQYVREEVVHTEAVQSGVIGQPGRVGPRGSPAAARVVVRSRPPPIAISAYQGGAPATAAPAPVAASPGPDGREPVAPRSPGGAEGEQASTSLGGQLGGGIELVTTKAGFVRNADYLIGAGTQIPCLPIETYNSAMGGFASCRVPEWVRGDTQRRGLLPPGTLVKGQIRGGMAQGQPRLGVLYQQIVTTGDRYQIKLAALGSDAQGRSGLDADINTFFWDTVGAVALYSLIQGVTNAIPQALTAMLQSGSNNNYSSLNFGGIGGGGGQSLAGPLLQHRLNRQPEAERDWAMPMFVTVGHDLDFSKVCKERAQFNQMACPLM